MKNSLLKDIFLIGIGAGFGAMLMHGYMTLKYEKEAYEEYDPDIYEEVQEEPEKEEDDSQYIIREDDILSGRALASGMTQPEIEEYKNRIKDYEPGPMKAYNINEDMFNEKSTNDGWTQTQLIMYSDGVLCDEYDEEINPDDIFRNGLDIDAFNNVDVVYYRNEDLKLDYEVIYDERIYSDVVPTAKPLDEEED